MIEYHYIHTSNHLHICPPILDYDGVLTVPRKGELIYIQTDEIPDAFWHVRTVTHIHRRSGDPRNVPNTVKGIVFIAVERCTTRDIDHRNLDSLQYEINTPCALPG
jgi:hypothetical protein